jgi:hypothetical protein
MNTNSNTIDNDKIFLSRIVKDAISSVLIHTQKSLKEFLPEQDVLIVNLVMKYNYNLKEVGRRLKLKESTIGKHFRISMGRILYRCENIKDTYLENEKLKKEIQNFKEENSFLRNKVKLINKENKKENKPIINIEKEKYEIKKIMEVLDIPLSQLGLSVRSLKAAYVFDIINIGDLVLCEQDIRKARNMGNVSYQELVDKLKVYGLKFIKEYNDNDYDEYEKKLKIKEAYRILNETKPIEY